MKSLLKSGFIYTFTNMLNRLMPFLLLPFLTRVLSQNEYGIISMTEVLIGIMLPIISLNSYGAVSRRFFDDKSNFGNYILTSLSLNIFTLFIFLFIFFVSHEFLESVLGIPYFWLNICLFIVLFKSGLQTVLTIYQINEKPITYSIIQVSNTIVNVLLTIILMSYLGFNWEGRIIAQLISFIFFAVIGIYFIRKLYPFSTYEKKEVKEDAQDIIKFGLPLIPHALGGMLITMTDRVILTNMIDLKTTGIYAAGAQIGMMIWMIQDAFNKAWIPFLFKKMKNGKEKDKRDIVKISYIYFITIIMLATLLSISSKLLTSVLLGEGFSEAYIYVPFIAFGFAFNGMYKMVSGPLFYLKKTKYLSYTTGVIAISNIILTITFIYLIGPVGAAISTCISFFIGFIIAWYISDKNYPLEWINRKDV